MYTFLKYIYVFDFIKHPFITAQKMKFSITDFFSKCDQIRRKLKKSLIENFIFCDVYKTHLGPSQITMAWINYSRTKTPSEIFNRALN